MARRTHRSHLLDIYGAWIHLATDAQQWRSVQRKITSLSEDVPESMGRTDFALWLPDTGGSTANLVVFIDLRAHTGDMLALVDTVAHEATHAAGGLLDHVGQKYDGNSEALAYLVGWLTSWIWRHVTTDLEAAS